MSAELPEYELQTLQRAAMNSHDGRTVALVFGTIDFLELLLNWCAFAVRAGVSWFVLVATDFQLHEALSDSLKANLVLLPRVRAGRINISKLNVIGERQRFGLRVLEVGLNVLHSDADALWLRDPSPLLQSGDIIAERIWGKPLSVVRAWGAAICTGFYFLRAKPLVLQIAREVEESLRLKRATHPSWQASDQLFINHVLHQRGVTWQSR